MNIEEYKKRMEYHLNKGIIKMYEPGEECLEYFATAIGYAIALEDTSARKEIYSYLQKLGYNQEEINYIEESGSEIILSMIGEEAELKGDLEETIFEEIIEKAGLEELDYQNEGIQFCKKRINKYISEGYKEIWRDVGKSINKFIIALSYAFYIEDYATQRDIREVFDTMGLNNEQLDIIKDTAGEIMPGLISILREKYGFFDDSEFRQILINNKLANN